MTRDTEEQEEEEQVIELGIRQREKRPLKKVKIHESANQIQGLNLDNKDIASFEEPKGDIQSNDRFV